MSATGEAQQPSAHGRWAAEQSVDIAGGWACETAGRDWVSGAVAGNAMGECDRRQDTGYGYWKSTRPPSDTAGRSADIAGGRHI